MMGGMGDLLSLKRKSQPSHIHKGESVRGGEKNVGRWEERDGGSRLGGGENWKREQPKEKGG